jgi:hypothetical protein
MDGIYNLEKADDAKVKENDIVKITKDPIGIIQNGSNVLNVKIVD